MRKNILRSALFVALLATILTSTLAVPASAAPLALPAPGALDPTFAGFTDDGIVVESGLIRAIGTALQPDGKIVVVGPTGTNNQLAVFRYLPNGKLDSSFDGDGKAIFSDMFSANNVALRSDGWIVVGGARSEDDGFQVARLTPAGALDPTFGQGGWLNDTDIRLGSLHTLLVQYDGKIVACGDGRFEGDGDFAVTRYNTNGARDFSFGNGIVFIGFGGKDACWDSAQQVDGKLVFAGYRRDGILFTEDDIAVARLETNGRLDDTSNGDGGFDGDCKLTTGFGHNESADSIAIQPDGKIVALGNDVSARTSYIARYNSNGSLDKTFDGDGKLSIPVDNLQDLAIQPDGKLLALGYHKSPDADLKFAIYRLLANGAPDTSFDGDGNVRLDFGGADEGLALALQPDGRILAAGTKGNVAVLVRLWPNGTTLDAGGLQTHGLPNPPGADEVANALAVQSDGKLLVAGELRSPVGAWRPAFLSRFLADGQIDPSFGNQGSSLAFGALPASPRPLPSSPTARSSSPGTPRAAAEPTTS